MSLVIRGYHDEDIEAVAAVINAAAQGDPLRMTTAAELRDAFAEPGSDPRANALVACTEAGQVVGFRTYRARLKRRDPVPILESSGAADPAFFSWGAPELLIRHMWQKCAAYARASRETGYIFQVRCDDTDTAMLGVLEGLGFTLNRKLVTLERADLEGIGEPTFPEYIDLRPYRPEIDMDGWYAAYEDAFDDHWGQMVWPYALWKHTVSKPGYQPALNLIAWDVRTSEIAGFCYAKVKGDIGEIRWLGVRPRWRRQGLADALTKAGLRAMRAAGAARCYLGADYESDTGPVRVYMRNGFAVIRWHLVYRREFNC